MDVDARIRTIVLLEKIERQKEFCKRIGIENQSHDHDEGGKKDVKQEFFTGKTKHQKGISHKKATQG